MSDPTEIEVVPSYRRALDQRNEAEAREAKLRATLEKAGRAMWDARAPLLSIGPNRGPKVRKAIEILTGAIAALSEPTAETKPDADAERIRNKPIEQVKADLRAEGVDVEASVASAMTAVREAKAKAAAAPADEPPKRGLAAFVEKARTLQWCEKLGEVACIKDAGHDGECIPVEQALAEMKGKPNPSERRRTLADHLPACAAELRTNIESLRKLIEQTRKSEMRFMKSLIDSRLVELLHLVPVQHDDQQGGRPVEPRR